MSKVIVTNTTKRPIVIGGRLIHVGASVECEAHDVPDALRDQLPTQSVAETADHPPLDAEQNPTAPTAEELLVAAVKGNKS